MTPDRIERALREGPPDEPHYVPGRFRAGHRLSVAAAAVVVAAALVAGVALGAGLDQLRVPGTGSGASPDLPTLARELEGHWVAEAVSRDAWIEGLVALGNDIDDVNSFVKPPNDVFDRSVSYLLVFESGTLTVSASFDLAPPVQVARGPYELLPDGRLRYDDLGCIVTVTPHLGDGLRFDPITTERCGADERVANSAFFNLVNYVRAGN